MKNFGFIRLVFAMAIFLSGCTPPKTQPNPSELIGIWKTDTIQTEWGTAIIEVSFENASDLEFKFIPIEAPNGQSIPSKGKYTLSGSYLTSDAINKGTPVSLWFEGGTLVIQAPGEEPMRFTRKI